MKRAYSKIEMKKFNIRMEEKVLAACGGSTAKYTHEPSGCREILSGDLGGGEACWGGEYGGTNFGSN